ncbi:MAG: Ig-like domain-containing protein [Gemmatimonadota bacterium]|nr:Ig-like domain-containing protein [Gemmatimonadota bacterium]
MLHFKKLDWSTLLLVLFASVLTLIAACVQPSGPLGAPNLAPTGQGVSFVRISLAQPSLATGQTTQATVVATSADGSVVGGHADFSSQNPSIATVSSSGVVTALTAGVSMIQATVASRAGSATLTVQTSISPVAVVAVTLDSTSLAIGDSAKASASAKDSAGNLISGLTIIWASVSPTVATVSSTGMVTAVAAGSATIQGTVSGKTGSVSLNVVTVPGPNAIAFHDFNDGKPGPFSYSGSDVTAIDYPADPTDSGRGKVNRIRYHPRDGLSSNDINMELLTAHHYRYGETIWFKGDVYIPSTLSDGVTQKTASQNLDTRKLIDYFSPPPMPRLILERTNGLLKYFVCQIEDDGQFHTDITWGSTGITLLNDTWYTIEVRLTLNSADGVKDGVLDVYINNPGAVPNFHLTSGISPITEKNGGSYFNSFRYGTQTTTYSGEAAYSEYRYWDNVGFSTTRMGQ